MFERLGREFLALLVPPLCAVCREPELSGAALCPHCRCGLIALPEPRCQRCGAPLVLCSRDCSECRDRSLAFARAWSPFAYEGVARQVVGGLKARGVVRLGGLIACELAARAPADLLAGTLVPVPAHSSRRRRDGFNQAEVIASALGRTASLPVRRLLERTGRAAPQVGLERRERLLNAAGSVRVSPGGWVPERLVLIDDVYTTGATLDACARALAARGAREVVALTFARTLRPD
jgi:ComF family protein